MAVKRREPDDIDRIRNALCDPSAPWYGSDLVDQVADLCEGVEELRGDARQMAAFLDCDRAPQGARQRERLGTEGCR